MRQNFVGLEYCPFEWRDGDIGEAFKARIEARRLYSATPRCSLLLQWPIRLPLGAQVSLDLLQRDLFRISVKCALEESQLTPIACA